MPKNRKTTNFNKKIRIAERNDETNSAYSFSFYCKKELPGGTNRNIFTGFAVFAVTLSSISKNLLPSIKSFCKSLASKVIIKRAVIHEIKSEELLTVIAKSKTPRICFVYLWWHISEQRFTDYLPITSSETPF